MIVILTIAPFSLNKNARVRLRRHCCRLYYHKMQQKLVNANAVREKGFVKEANPVLKTFIGFLSSQPHQKQHHLDPPHLVAVVHSGAEVERNRAGEKKVVVVVEKKLFMKKSESAPA